MKLVPVTPDCEEFLQAVRDYVGPYTGQFNYNEMLAAFGDKSRFYHLAQLIEEHHLLQDANVLSSGCGFGGNLVAYADHGARLAIGVEVDPHYIRLSGLRVGSLPAACVVHYDGEHLPFADASFDIVDSIQVLEHVQDPECYLREIWRVMRPGGICYIEFPNRAFPYEQHTNVPLVNWLPKPIGDALSNWFSRLPFLTPQRASRLRVVREISRRYISLITLYRLLKSVSSDIEIRYLEPGHPLLRRISRLPLARFVLPNTTTRVVVVKRSP